MTGFELIPEVISEATELGLVERIKKALDGLPESGHGKTERSRVKRYGYDYAPKLRMIEPIPEWVGKLPNRDYPGFIAKIGMTINSVTINEYQQGHGITPHTDADYFGPVIAILSLGGMAVMEVFSPETRTWTLRERIPGRSLLILSGEIRRTWKHGIDGGSVTETRYSIVFRERLLK